MSRRRIKQERQATGLELARAHEGLAPLRLVSARADLIWLADHQRDVAAREAGTGKALTGMPRYQSMTPSLPGTIGGPDLSGDIARELDTLVRELMDALPDWTPDERETVRWRQAAMQLDAVCATEHDALAWWDTAGALRQAAERVLGPDAHGRWLGPCPVPSCPGEVRMGDDQAAAVCADCGVFVTREQQHEYIREVLDDRIMTLSEIATALVQVGAPTPYDTVKSWALRRRLTEHVEWHVWEGFPYVPAPTGLYRFGDAFALAARRATRVEVSARRVA